MLLNEEDFEIKTEQEIPDVNMPNLEVSEIQPETPKEGADMGIANLIHDLIIDEHEAILGYNAAIANLETRPELIPIMQDIANEEMNHIGMLEKALEIISPNATNIPEGAEEAKVELADESEEDPGSPVDESFISKKYGKDFAKSLDEAIVSSYIDIDANELGNLREGDVYQILRVAPVGAVIKNVLDYTGRDVHITKVNKTGAWDFSKYPVQQKRDKIWTINGYDVNERQLYMICAGMDNRYKVK